MGLLNDLAHFLSGSHQDTRHMSFPGGVVKYVPLTDAQQAQANAKIAADGAAMYNAAHPGKQYVLGQNGETLNGGVDQASYLSRLRMLSAPKKPVAANFSAPQVNRSLFSATNPQANHYGGDFGTPIQGMQNPGFIPVQGSQFQSYMPIQNGYNQRIQF